MQNIQQTGTGNPTRARVPSLAACALALLASLHFCLAILGSCDFDFARLGKLGAILSYYGEASGSNSRFAFFSPGIGSQLRVRFLVKAAEGSAQLVDMVPPQDREASLRIGNIFDQFFVIADSEDEHADDMRRSLAASLAAHMFSRYPAAKSITVKIDEFIPTTLREIHAGPLPAWQPIYEVEFASNGSNS